jgi:hypothetical protein
MAVLDGTAPAQTPIIPASPEAQLARQKSVQAAMFRGQTPEVSPASTPRFPSNAHVAPVGEEGSSSGGSPSGGTFTRWLRNLVGGANTAGSIGNPGSTGVPHRPSPADGSTPSDSTGSGSAATGSNAESLKAQKKKQVRMYRGQIVKDE